MPVKLTQEQAEEKVKNTYDGSYRLISLYENVCKPATFIHTVCGTEFTLRRFKEFGYEINCKCPKCHPKIKSSVKNININNIAFQVKDKSNGLYTYIDGFVNSTTKMNIRCNNCNSIFSIAPSLHLGIKLRGCPKCANIKRGKFQQIENYLEKIMENAEYSNEYEWLEEYHNDNKEKLLIKHKKCGHIYRQRPNDFQQGYRCPKCFNLGGSSRYYTYIVEYLDKYNPQLEVSFDGCVYKKQMKCDIYLNSLNLVIEFDGEQHFTEKQIGYGTLEVVRNRDIAKNNYFKKHEVRLIRIKKIKKNFTIKFCKELLDIVLCKNETVLVNFIKKNKNIFYINEDSSLILNEDEYYQLL